MRIYVLFLVFLAGLLFESCKTVNPPKSWSRNTRRPNKSVKWAPQAPRNKTVYHQP